MFGEIVKETRIPFQCFQRPQVFLHAIEHSMELSILALVESDFSSHQFLLKLHPGDQFRGARNLMQRVIR